MNDALEILISNLHGGEGLAICEILSDLGDEASALDVLGELVDRANERDPGTGLAYARWAADADLCNPGYLPSEPEHAASTARAREILALIEDGHCA